MYPLVDCAREYIRHLKSAGQQDRDRYWKARAESEKEKARKLATENRLRGGRLPDAGEVESMQRELGHRLRQLLAMIPARIADQFGENGDRARIEEAVAPEIEAMVDRDHEGVRVPHDTNDRRPRRCAVFRLACRVPKFNRVDEGRDPGVESSPIRHAR